MLEDIKNDRLKKRANLEAAGFDVYPASVKRTSTLSVVLETWPKLMQKQSKVTLVGRVFAVRGQGGISFIDLKDEHGALQLVVSQDKTKDFAIVRDNLDIGDFVEATGVPFVTKKGEKSIEVKSWRVITKSARPIPSEWYGIADPETRLRKRYLDLMLNPELREMFRKKAAFWSSIRLALTSANFMEVETPALEAVPGGADARPFLTHMNALDIDLHMRISLELNQKRLLVGGYERVFEIGRVFRNEGIDAEHLQDYTAMEFYWAYADYDALMKFVEKFYKTVIKATTGKLITTYQGNKINWGKKWAKLDYCDAFKEKTGIAIDKATLSQLEQKAQELGLKPEPNIGKGRLIDLIYKKLIRPFVIQPTLLINHPIDISPLAKRHRTSPYKTERVQVLAGGSELGNGWSELNDPVDQRGRFEEQARLRAAGDEEAQMMDEDFVEALEYGMPPAAGFGLSERVFAVLMDKPIRETVFFPMMRPKKLEAK